VSPVLLILVGIALLNSRDELRELGLVLRLDLGQSENSSGLLVDYSAKAGLALDDGVWDTHLAAEGGEEDDKLDRIDIIGDEDESSLLVLYKADDVVETILDCVRLLGRILALLALGDSSSLLGESLLLLSLGLWSVLVQQLEDLCGLVAVEDVLELGDRWWDLEAHGEDLLLSLKTNILWPLHHARQVALRLDILADTIIAGTLLEERVLRWLLGRRLLRTQRGSGDFLALWSLQYQLLNIPIGGH